MKAHLRRIRISSKKVNVVAGLVRGKSVDEALNVLQFTPKKAARVLFKVVQSAFSNAVNNDKQEKEALYVKHIVVNI